MVHLTRQMFAAAGQRDTFVLRNVRLPTCLVSISELPIAGDGLVSADLTVTEGRIGDISAPDTHADQHQSIDLAGSMVWPGLVDCHTHIDKGQVWPRSPNPDGTFASALIAARAEAEQGRSADDIRRRAEFQLKAAYAHGTIAIRSHVDGTPEMFDTAFEVLHDLATDWSDRIALQLCPFAGIDDTPDWLEHLAQTAARTHSGVLSLFLQSSDRLDRFLDDVMALAAANGLALDFHADENIDPDSHCLRAVAKAVVRNRFEHPVLAGHCCALSVQSIEELDCTLDLVAEASIGIVSLPLCNAYLQDREAGRSPRRRGFAPVHEMRARGIPVAIGSDNVRDPFYAYGDLDAVELFRDAVRMMQLDHPVGDWVSGVTSVPANMMGLDGLGRVEVGRPADLVVFSARNWNEFVSRPQSDRIVMRRGQAIDTAPPSFDELDDLDGMPA